MNMMRRYFTLIFCLTLGISYAQEAIINEIKRISYGLNPKIWIGVKWLSTYISIRPKELINLKEEHIDRKNGFFIITNPKEKKPKIVPLIDEDISIVKRFAISFPNLPFFRHNKKVKGCKPGKQFGEKYFYKWWRNFVFACRKIQT